MVAPLMAVCAVVGCGSSSSTPSTSSSPSPSRTTASLGAEGTTLLTKAQQRFARVLNQRCRRTARSLDRITTPSTLPAQAKYSAAHERILSQLLSDLRRLGSPPPPRYARGFVAALTSVIQADGYIIDAAKSQNAAGVAHWLAEQAGARHSLDLVALALAATGCRL
jgi:hypothetical protein